LTWGLPPVPGSGRPAAIRMKSASAAAIGTPAAFRCLSETPPGLSRRITIISDGRRQKLEPSRATRLSRPGTLITAHGACAEMLSLSRPTANDNRSIIRLRRANPPTANSITWKSTLAHPIDAAGGAPGCADSPRARSPAPLPPASPSRKKPDARRRQPSTAGSPRRSIYSGDGLPASTAPRRAVRSLAGQTAVCNPAAHARADLLPRAAPETSPAEWRSERGGRGRGASPIVARALTRDSPLTSSREPGKRRSCAAWAIPRGGLESAAAKIRLDCARKIR